MCCTPCLPLRPCANCIRTGGSAGRSNRHGASCCRPRARSTTSHGGPPGATPRRPLVDHWSSVPTREWKRRPLSLRTLRDIAGLRRELREDHYDICVDMQGSIRSAIVGRMAGAARVCRSCRAARGWRVLALRTKDPVECDPCGGAGMRAAGCSRRRDAAAREGHACRSIRRQSDGAMRCWKTRGSRLH